MSNVYLPAIANGPDFTATGTLRLGIGIGERNAAWRRQSLAVLHPPAWQNWSANALGDPAYIPHCFWLDGRAASEAALQVAATMPDRLWELGNEPELDWAAVDPAVAAQFVARWRDRCGANFAAPGVIISDSGLAWLEAYLAAGGPVGELWNVHLYYALDGVMWRHLWERWLTWQHVRRLERPSLISETNAWPGGDQLSVLDTVADTLQDAMLHTALWYSDNDYWNRFHDPDLRTADGWLTAIGQRYRSLLGGGAAG